MDGVRFCLFVCLFVFFFVLFCFFVGGEGAFFDPQNFYVRALDVQAL